MSEDTVAKPKRSKLRTFGYCILALVVIVVLGFFLALQYYKHQHESTIARLTERGFHTTMEDIKAAHPLVPEADDAMAVYRAADKDALEDVIQVCSNKEGEWQCTAYSERSEDLEPQLFELLTELEPWQDKVLAATKLPGLNISWEENEGYAGHSQKDLGSIRRVMKYLGDQCYSAVLQEKPEEALTWMEAQFRLMEQSKSAKFLIGGMIRSALARIPMDSVQVALDRDVWQGEQRAQVDALLATWYPEQIFTDAMVSEVGFSVVLMDQQFKDQGLAGPAMYYIYADFYDFYDQLIVGNAPNFEIDREVLECNPKKEPMLVQMLLPSISRSAMEVDKINIKRDFARLAIGLKQYKSEHGDYPDSLSVLDAALLIDAGLSPDTGERYGYNRQDDGFNLSHTLFEQETRWAFTQ